MRESRRAAARVDRGDDDDAAPDGDLQQFGEQRILRPGEARIDDPDVALDREVQCLGKAQRITHRAVSPTLPAGTQTHQSGLGRDAGDTQAIVRDRRDDAGYAGAVLLGRGRAADKILAERDLAAQIWMVVLDPAVDHRDGDAARRVAIWWRSASRHSFVAGCSGASGSPPCAAAPMV